MTPLRTTLTLLLLAGAVVLAAGCVGNTTSSNVKKTPAPVVTTIPSDRDLASGYWIRIDRISDKNVGEIFTITSTTNLSVGEEVLIQVYYVTTTSLDRRTFRGTQGFTKIIPGNNGINKTSFTVNTSGYYPDLYIATEQAVNFDAVGAAKFNITSDMKGSVQ